MRECVNRQFNGMAIDFQHFGHLINRMKMCRVFSVEWNDLWKVAESISIKIPRTFVSFILCLIDIESHFLQSEFRFIVCPSNYLLE